MPELARESLLLPVKTPLNAMDVFSGRCEGFRIKLSDESLDRAIWTSLDEERLFAGSQMR